MDEEGIDVFVKEKSFGRFVRESANINKMNGVAELALFCHSGTSSWEEIAPARVKKLVTGSGSATKQDVQNSLAAYFHPNARQGLVFKTDDESDALAVVIAYMIGEGMLETIPLNGATEKKKNVKEKDGEVIARTKK